MMRKSKIISKLTFVSIICITFLEILINFYTYEYIKDFVPYELFRQILILNIVLGVAIAVLGTILNYKIVSPLKQIKREMDNLVTGKRRIKDIKPLNDELGDIFIALKELDISLSIKDYEWKNIINSYYRFVPRGINKLLNRASIMETDLLDMASIEGNVSILSASNLDNLRFEMNDTEFMKYINNLFALIYDKIEENDAILLTEDYNLSALKLYHKEESNSGIKFGLSLFGEVKSYFKQSMPDLFLMLHNTGFLYGVAGTKDAAFPFLSSSEMAFLSSFNSNFLNLKTKMVVTEQFLNSSDFEISTRYIGFISSDDTDYTYKVYEVLDVYSDIEKVQKLRCNKDFQEGIRLFYENKFYNARNMFSKIIKSCNEDFVAKWYLFACENYLNDVDYENVKYNLFGIKS